MLVPEALTSRRLKGMVLALYPKASGPGMRAAATGSAIQPASAPARRRIRTWLQIIRSLPSDEKSKLACEGIELAARTKKTPNQLLPASYWNSEGKIGLVF